MTAQEPDFASDQAWINPWLDSLDGLKPQTRKSYLESLRRVQEAHAGSLLEMTPASLQAAFDRMSQSWGMSSNTIRATKTPLRKLVRHLVRQGKLSEAEAETLLKQALYQESQVRRRSGMVLDFRLSEVLAKAAVPESRLILFLTVVVGVTIPELVRLTWGDLDEAEQFMVVANQPGAERVVSFDDRGWPFLMELAAQLPSAQRRSVATQPLLVDRRGQGLDYVEIHRIIQEELKKHDIPATPAQICPNASVMGERYILLGLDFQAIRSGSVNGGDEGGDRSG